MGLIKKKKEELKSKVNVCPVCDFEFKGEYDYCPECGADLRGNNEEDSSENVSEPLINAESENTATEGTFNYDGIVTESQEEDDNQDFFEDEEFEEDSEVEEFEDEIGDIDEFLDGLDDSEFEEANDDYEDEYEEEEEDFTENDIEEEYRNFEIPTNKPTKGNKDFFTEPKENETEEMSIEDEEENDSILEEVDIEEPQTFLQQLANEKPFEKIQIAELYGTTQPQGMEKDTIVARRLEDGKVDVIVGGTIPVKMIEATDEEAELLHIDEELKTTDLTLLERGKRIAREKELESHAKTLFDVSGIHELNGLTKAEIQQYISVYKGLGDDFSAFDLSLETASELSSLKKKDQKLVSETATEMGLVNISPTTAKMLAKKDELNEINVMKILARDIQTQSEEKLMIMIKDAVREILGE